MLLQAFSPSGLVLGSTSAHFKPEHKKEASDYIKLLRSDDIFVILWIDKRGTHIYFLENVRE